MTDIKLNLVPVPSKTGLAILHFEDLYTALRSVPAILEVEPSAVELLDNLALTMCRSVPEYARLLSTFIAGSPNCVLITEFYGESEAELTAKIDRLQTHLDKLKIGAQTNPILSPAHQNNVWTVRKAGLGLLMSIKGDHKPVPFIEDAAVPVEHLADYVTQIEAFCNARGIKVAYYAHASAGCLHIRPSVNTKDAEEIAKMPEISHFTLDLLKGYGGALSSEHGDGRARSWLNEQFFGKELFDLFRQVKVAFDPISLLNPGNIVDGGPMDQNLRFGSDYEPVALEEHLDFREDLGFNRAVEMCNGAAICRKRTTGTMCPSFMVTRDEEHSTRGRANALRAAISGQLAVEELTSPRMYKVMDLCVECKACKAECPSSVDMAKIKFEFLAHYYETHPVSRRTKLFADIARWSRLSSGRLAPLINLGLKNPILRWGLQQYAGIDRTRRLPEFARQPFNVWFNRRPYSLRPTNPTGGKKRKVILFNDTFNTYNYPHVARSAAELLEAAGFVVGLPGHKCCGRPMISKGLVKEARAAAKDTVQRLAPFARAGIPIVGLEPSCILSLRDEYLYLLPDNPDVHIVADNTYTFEEFFTELAASGDLHLRFTDQPKRLLLHGHCHQKALIGTGPTEKAITLPANYEVEVVDSGCCGMAGAFGYEAEHYHVSMAMAERRLLPAVRTASADTIVVAPGVSCRQQILHGTGRNAAHPAEVLREALILL
jgi:Fe-S oxidoreductase